MLLGTGLAGIVSNATLLRPLFPFYPPPLLYARGTEFIKLRNTLRIRIIRRLTPRPVASLAMDLEKLLGR